VQDATALNKALWDARGRAHGQDAYYDAAGLIAGADTLSPLEAAAAGDVAGLDVLHLQCHIGFDAISLARRGARVTGLDFSPASLAKARELAARAEVPVEFVEGDATDLPPALAGRFDLVYATLGVLCWIGDLDAWMRSVAAALRPSGRLALVELHPLYLMLDSVEPLRVDFPYQGAEPRRFDEPGSYADPDLRLAATESVQYAHGLGEVVSAAVRAGLRVERLEEHAGGLERDPRGDVLPREADGLHRLRVGGELLPTLFTLAAVRER
jgi:SAM-dependent methyltransferase